MKLAVIYDSKTGNTKQAGEWIVAGMNGVTNIEAKAFSIHEVEEAFVKEAKGVVVGSPSYAAIMTPDLHAWMIASAGKLGFAGKLGGAFATEQLLCYSSGNACGMPVIHLGPVAVNGNVEAHNSMEHYKEYFMIYGRRFAEKALDVFNLKV